MTIHTPSTVHLKDYKAPEYYVKTTHLEFDLYSDHAIVSSELHMEQNGNHAADVYLHGQELELLSLSVDGQVLNEQQYQVSANGVSFSSPGNTFLVKVVCRIFPQNNTSLEGLYRSKSLFCTQCEAEGFRKITYYVDRPDNLSVFTTKVIADKNSYPTLLSNGNCVARGEAEDGRHWAEWHDPFPKPSYLFALVAGNLSKIDDHFVTMGGRKVDLQIFVEPKDLDKCDHAMASLKNAMRWDEEVYGREYDLDIYMIVAVDDFNMGAMENKGLNIFNTSCVLANSATTTDAGFARVEAVVAHEYFHNWSGNRVTCRDWFQLSLKEGFTVFRDAEFSADMGSRTVKRVEDVQLLRSAQFAEDAGPMAHPVRPESFIEISNFYTLTVYEKGAEVVRMIRTLIGEELFRKGSDLYFERHDGQAVTVEDFVQAMADVSNRDFSQFMNWYRQAGTPIVEVYSEYDQDAQKLTLRLSQTCPSTPEASTENKKPFVIPISIGLLGDSGFLQLKQDGASSSLATETVLELTEFTQEFIFSDVQPSADGKPAVSLLRGFSAPVKLQWDRDLHDLRKIITLETDGFARWEATQELAIQAIDSVNFPENHALKVLVDAYRMLLADHSLDPAMVALMLDLPSENYLCQLQEIMDIDRVVSSRQALSESIAEQLQAEFRATYERCHNELQGRGLDVSAQAMALRSLKNTALNYLMLVDDDINQSICIRQFNEAENMTDSLASLKAIVHSRFSALNSVRSSVLETFYQRWQHEALVVNYWLSLQASDPGENALDNVRSLMKHDSFDMKNPNKLRSVVGVFANQNMRNFHRADGLGYAFLTDQILLLNQQNPQIAARLVAPLSKWKKLDPERSKAMKNQLERLAQCQNLSKDVFEVVSKSLAE